MLFPFLWSFCAQKIFGFLILYLLVFILSISFHLFCAFCVAKRFLKKFKLVFETSYIILLMFTPLNSPIFHQIYHQILWSRALFLFICTYSPLLELIRICENIFFLVGIFESVLFSVENWFFKSLWKQASVEYYHLICIFHHQNVIMVFCWLHVFQFYVFLLWILLILCLITFLLNKMSFIFHFAINFFVSVIKNFWLIFAKVKQVYLNNASINIFWFYFISKTVCVINNNTASKSFLVKL